MAKQPADGNVATEGKTPVDIGALVSQSMDSWGADIFDNEDAEETQAVSDGDETAESEEDSGAETESDAQEDTPDMSKSDEEQENAEGSEEETAGGYDDGIAGALRYIKDNEDNIPPSVAKAVRNLQAEFTKVTTDRSSKERDLEDKLSKVDALLAEIEEQKEQPEEEPDANDPLNRISQDQWDLFERMAQKMGYIKQETIDTKERETAQSQYLRQARSGAAERFGDVFGTVGDAGDVALSDDAQRVVKAEYERLADPKRGVSEADLFILGNFDALLKKAADDAVEAFKQEQATRTQKRVLERKEAQTIDSSKRPAAPMKPKIKYDRKDPRAFDQVMNQAFALGFTAAKKVV